MNWRKWSLCLYFAKKFCLFCEFVNFSNFCNFRIFLRATFAKMLKWFSPKYLRRWKFSFQPYEESTINIIKVIFLRKWVLCISTGPACYQCSTAEQKSPSQEIKKMPLLLNSLHRDIMMTSGHFSYTLCCITWWRNTENMINGIKNWRLKTFLAKFNHAASRATGWGGGWGTSFNCSLCRGAFCVGEKMGGGDWILRCVTASICQRPLLKGNVRPD